MTLKLDDLLIKKKESVQILDLSKNTTKNREELKKLIEKVPEFKIRPEKIKPEEIKIHDKKFSFKICKKKSKQKTFSFANPVPPEMKSLRLADLCSVDIQWKMLTSLRPRNKLDEEYYSKLVDLGKWQISAKEKQKKTPISSYIKRNNNKAGSLETKIISCRDCDEEFCLSETCGIFSYDSYERLLNMATTAELTTQNTIIKRKRKQKKRKTNAEKKNRLKKKVFRTRS